MSRQENISKSFCFLWEDIPSVQIYPVFTFAQEERRKEAQDFSHCFLFFCSSTLKKKPNPPQKKLPLKWRNRGEGNIQTCQLFLPLFRVLGGGKKKGGIEASPENFLHPFCGARASFSPIFSVCFFTVLLFWRGAGGPGGESEAPRCWQVWIFAVLGDFSSFRGIFPVFGGRGGKVPGGKSDLSFFLVGNRIFYPFSRGKGQPFLKRPGRKPQVDLEKDSED